MPRVGEGGSTPDRILDVAEHFAQTRGYNGFSYADIALALQVSKASLHYHFPTKAHLGLRLIERYSERFDAALAAIDATEPKAPARLRRYVDIYAAVLAAGRMCLCGMLAADYATLPEAMRGAVSTFFDLNERWLVTVLTEGLASGALRFTAPPLTIARLLIGSLEGAMLLARSFDDPSRFTDVADRLLLDLIPPAALATSRRAAG